VDTTLVESESRIRRYPAVSHLATYAYLASFPGLLWPGNKANAYPHRRVV